ncbi:MAG TPA: glycoside hydrolase family 3 N-terminal domain-containing protein [Actinomycetales bacterium]
MSPAERSLVRVGVALTLVLGAACSGSGSAAGTTGSATATTSTTTSATTATTSTTTATTTTTSAATTAGSPTSAAAAARLPDPVTRVLRVMTLEQRVGQLFMVGGAATGTPRSTRSAVTDLHVGSVMLTGRSSAGIAATARVSARVRALATRSATAGVPLFVATDQEGGAVRVLRGSGFSTSPSALVQGGWSAATLRSRAAGWGRELRAAGVDVNLAPVADTVPSRSAARSNAPIGRFGRQYGFTSDVVTTHAVAFSQGMAQAGVVATAKHFPGLGRVTGNTDVTAGVTDRTTTRRDPLLAPFAAAIRARTPFVMMSTAYYSRIDPARPAVFSPVVIDGMLRRDLGFTGVVISDDLGSARQVARWSPGDRAVAFVRAGGDLVLTVDPATLPAMYRAVLARARTDAIFRARVEVSVRRVLTAKHDAGLLG